MPKSTRQDIKQKLDAGIHAIDRASEHFTAVGCVFEKHPSVYYDQFCAILASLEATKKVAEQIREKI